MRIEQHSWYDGYNDPLAQWNTSQLNIAHWLKRLHNKIMRRRQRCSNPYMVIRRAEIITHCIGLEVTQCDRVNTILSKKNIPLIFVNSTEESDNLKLESSFKPTTDPRSLDFNIRCPWKTTELTDNNIHQRWKVREDEVRWTFCWVFGVMQLQLLDIWHNCLTDSPPPARASDRPRKVIIYTVSANDYCYMTANWTMLDDMTTLSSRPLVSVAGVVKVSCKVSLC